MDNKRIPIDDKQKFYKNKKYKKDRPWKVEYKFANRVGDWHTYGMYKTREEAINVMDNKKRSWGFFDFRAIGPG